MTGHGSGDDFELCQRCYQQACAQAGVPPPASGGDQADDADDDDRDDDGAAILGDGASVAPKLKLPPGVPVPSQQMVRRHLAAGNVRPIAPGRPSR